MWFDERVWKFLDALAWLLAFAFALALLGLFFAVTGAMNGEYEWSMAWLYLAAAVVLAVVSTLLQRAAKRQKQRDPRYRQR